MMRTTDPQAVVIARPTTFNIYQSYGLSPAENYDLLQLTLL